MTGFDPERSRRADARAAAETVARDAYGRLVAILAARTGDLAAAEDALGDAFERALSRWPQTGPPDNPQAWLLKTAQRRIIDASRRSATAHGAVDHLAILADEAASASAEPLADRRLTLMAACAHPAIDASVRTPLILQTVLGLSAERIASTFLVSPAAMGQRLSRAKAKIREAGIRFEPPQRHALGERLEAICQSIYAAYSTGWEMDDPTGGALIAGLASEAIHLARLVTALAPQRAEPKALLALILYCEARRSARRDGEDRFIPLSEQDPALWDHAMIEEAETLLKVALAGGPPGRFGLEAAIQSVHSARARTGHTDWRALATLYDRLAELGGGVGARLARAAALGEAEGALIGLEALAGIEADAGDSLGDHQPYWATRAHLLVAAGRLEGALASYRRAAGLARDPRVRDFLLERADRLAR
ncbi:MAG: DUF6596 domain-containing protein [Pseudomonadota bacterium]